MGAGRRHTGTQPSRGRWGDWSGNKLQGSVLGKTEPYPCYREGGTGASRLRPVSQSPGSQEGPLELQHLPTGLSFSLPVLWRMGGQGRAVAEACESTGAAGPWLLPSTQTQRGRPEEPRKLLLKEKTVTCGVMRQGRPGSSGWIVVLSEQPSVRPDPPGPADSCCWTGSCQHEPRPALATPSLGCVISSGPKHLPWERRRVRRGVLGPCPSSERLGG